MFKYNRAQEQRGLIEGHFPVFDVGPAERKCSSFIYSCQSGACKCGNQEKTSSGRLKLIYHNQNKKKTYSNI